MDSVSNDPGKVTRAVHELHCIGMSVPRPPVPLRRDVLLIGSDEGVAIRLKSNRVAPLHAVLARSAGAWWLRDLGSATGSFVNDRRVAETKLHSGDVLRFGPFQFRYVAPEPIPDASGSQPTPLPDATLRVTASGRLLTLQKPLMAIRSIGEGVESASALIVVTPSGHLVHTLNPKRPLVVSGTTALQHVLVSGDTIRIGAVQIEYIVQPSGQTVQRAPALEAGRVARPPILDPQPQTSLPHELPSGTDVESTQCGTSVPSSGDIGEKNRVAPPVTPATFKPLVGRRVRTTVNPEGPHAAGVSGDIAAPPGSQPEADQESDWRDARGRSLLPHLLLMLLCMGASAAFLWRSMPPTYLVRQQMTFRGSGSERLLNDRQFLADQQGALFSETVVRSAALKASGAVQSQTTRKAAAAPDPQLVAALSELQRRASMDWLPPTGDENQATLVVTLRSLDPARDIPLLAALFQAFYPQRAQAVTKPSSETLKIDLLQTEVEQLKLQIAFQKQYAAQIRRDVQIIEASLPSTLQIDLRKRRELALWNALEAAIAAHAQAEMELARQRPADKPSSRPTTAPSPSTRRADDGRTAPPLVAGADAGGLPSADEHLSKVRQALKDAEADVRQRRAELAEALSQSGEVEAKSGQVAAMRQRLTAAQRELPILEEQLKQKRQKLGEAERRAGRVTALPPPEPQVVQTSDERGMWIAGATFAIAMAFTAAMTWRGRRDAGSDAGTEVHSRLD